MIGELYLDGQRRPGLRGLFIGIGPYPVFVGAEIWVCPREYSCEEPLTFFQHCLQVVQGGRIEEKRLFLMLVQDELGLYLAPDLDTAPEASTGAQEVTISAAVIVQSGWRAGIPGEEYACTMSLYKQPAVVE